MNEMLASLKEQAGPAGVSLSFGGAAGMCTGFCLKKLGKVVAVGFGGLYCLFQAAAVQGYINVNWDKVEKDFTFLLDSNGDGKLDEKDARVMLLKTAGYLTQETGYSAGGFLGGMLIGIRKG